MRGQAPAAANGHSDIQVKHDPLTSTQLHSPTLSKDAPVPRRDSAQPKAPQNIYEEHGKEHSTGAAMPEADNPEAHWVLTPRRVHAALNAGVKSLSENARILMVAWPGDVRDVDGEKTGAGTLTEKQRVELEDGFASLAGRSETNGIQCVPVWMEDGTAERFYVDYCKTYLWPTFHYLGMSDHQDKQKEAKAWKAYYDANVAYAERVASVYKDGDLVSQAPTLESKYCILCLTYAYGGIRLVLADLGTGLSPPARSAATTSQVPQRSHRPLPPLTLPD